MGSESENCGTLAGIARRIRAVEEPENLFKGKRLPRGMALPDDILIFYHDFCAAQPNTHGRYTLVIPLAEMCYLLDNQQIELQPGNLLLIRPHQIRFLQPDSAGYGRLFITFTLPRPQPYLPSFPVGQLTDDLRAILSELIDAYLDGRTFEVSVRIVWLLKRIAAVKLAAPPKTVSDLTANAVRWINEHLSESFSIDTMARELHASGGNLRLHFRNEIGASVGHFIAQQRLNLAKHYLKSTTLDITEIADRCGFASIYAFSHFFKNATGKSPKSFR